MIPPVRSSPGVLAGLVVAGIVCLVPWASVGAGESSPVEVDAPTDLEGEPEAEANEGAILPSRPPRPAGEPGLGAVVVDRTITMMGKTFFRRFAQLRLESGVLQSTDLTIVERPSARFGSQIWVTTRGSEVLFAATLPPRPSEIMDIADSAAEQVETALVQRELERLFRDGSDLADEEF
ncbi:MULTISPECIES: CsgE family curli-type amyloid fiber assembly protein [unclassified Thioalkalivibrio]|uniref:CsgE family curli-type amyloid fiber assembly protein n=1 Tax=unclassified Thioalkalivibrio TaxID=2621013 RepID=UPI000380F148|nr:MULTISPECIES: CsgE family curli-type amyloid fiber assembly protein [unclassified Thioalkalivibrio]